MERRQGRQISAEEKLRVLEEARQPGVTISEVCRRHQIAATQYYDWERRARQAALEGLASKRKSKGNHPTIEEGLRADIVKLHEVVIALTTENVRLKKGVEQL